jgi:hypothetical protein
MRCRCLRAQLRFETRPEGQDDERKDGDKRCDQTEVHFAVSGWMEMLVF